MSGDESRRIAGEEQRRLRDIIDLPDALQRLPSVHDRTNGSLSNFRVIIGFVNLYAAVLAEGSRSDHSGRYAVDTDSFLTKFNCGTARYMNRSRFSRRIVMTSQSCSDSVDACDVDDAARSL